MKMARQEKSHTEANQHCERDTVALMDELARILELHRIIRLSLFPHPCPEAHFVNENTVVRLASVMEAYEFKPTREGVDDNISCWPTVCTRTLFFFRNLIVHRPQGRLCLDKLNNIGHKDRRFYDAFCAKIAAAKVDMDEALCLDGQEVLQPLLDGCINYVESRRSRDTLQASA